MGRCSIRYVLCICTIIISPGEGYKYFQGHIPNGDNVPHPCKTNYIWEGVGHRNNVGGGARNPFGLAFFANDKVWNSTLCQADSDGDGKTNGEELGDPTCVWTPGTTPQISTDLSHPGVCDPWDSAECQTKNEWEFCGNSQEFSCPAMDNTEDVRNITLRFPQTDVPSQETTYFCLTFDLPVANDTDFHLIATTPEIDNAYVMHHMLLYGCEDEAQASQARNITSPSRCGMAAGCTALVAKWTLGVSGNCGPEKAGYRIGQTGFKTFVLQLHWNNPELRSDYTDSSGMTIYYTPNLREFDAGTILMGQTYLEIPGGTANHQATGFISSFCSSTFMSQPIQIFDTFLHMHYLGRSAKLEHRRLGQMIESLGEDEVYSYDSPHGHRFDPSLLFEPGDEAHLTCIFDSTSKTEVTYYGDATSAEMCFAFIEYYPANKNLSNLAQYKDFDFCESKLNSNKRVGIIDGCDMDAWLELEVETTAANLTTICDPLGQTCRPSCIPYLRGLKASRCLGQDGPLARLKKILDPYPGMEYVWNAFDSCSEEELKSEDDAASAAWLTRPVNAVVVLMLSAALL